MIHVNAGRSGGFCIGSIYVNLYTYSFVNEKLHLANIFDDVAALIHPKNLNNYVLNTISRAFEQLK